MVELASYQNDGRRVLRSLVPSNTYPFHHNGSFVSKLSYKYLDLKGVNKNNNNNRNNKKIYMSVFNYIKLFSTFIFFYIL